MKEQNGQNGIAAKFVGKARFHVIIVRERKGFIVKQKDDMDGVSIPTPKYM